MLSGTDDTVHVLWAGPKPDIYTAHTHRLPDGSWQTPQLLRISRLSRPAPGAER